MTGQFVADEVGKYGLLLSNVVHDLLVDPRLHSFFYQHLKKGKGICNLTQHNTLIHKALLKIQNALLTQISDIILWHSLQTPHQVHTQVHAK